MELHLHSPLNLREVGLGWARGHLYLCTMNVMGISYKQFVYSMTGAGIVLWYSAGLRAG
jgi:hypothetical protein